MAESKIVIVPLIGTNYSTWKIQCKMSLIKIELGGLSIGVKEHLQRLMVCTPICLLEKSCISNCCLVH